MIAVNSGYGVQFNAAANRGQQSLAVIDLNAKPAAVIQNVYFPSPQSVNFGVVFAPAINCTYWGGAGMGAWRESSAEMTPIRVGSGSRYPKDQM